MMVTGHMALGALTYYAASDFFGVPTEPWMYGVAIIGALLPDLDQPNSTLGQLVPTVSGIIKRVFGHRGISHSLLMLLFLTTCAFAFSDMLGGAIAPLCWGYASHLLGDYMTKSGIPFFWPITKKVSLPGLAFTTGSRTEDVLTFAMVVVIALQLSKWVWA